MALVHNPSDSSSPPSLLATAVEASLSHLTPSKAWSLVTSLLELEDPQDRAAILSLASEAGVGESKMEKFLEDEAVFKTMQNHRIFSSRVLKLEPGQTALLSNGRVGKYIIHPAHVLNVSVSPLPVPSADWSPLSL